jgi:hypothetical protein
MIGWITRLFSKTSSEPRAQISGFIVTERDTGKVVYREMKDFGHCSAKKAATKTWKRRRQLERKYSPYQYDVQDGAYNSREAFEHFAPELDD